MRGFIILFLCILVVFVILPVEATVVQFNATNTWTMTMSHTNQDPPQYNNATYTDLSVDRGTGGEYTIFTGWMGDSPQAHITGNRVVFLFDTSSLPNDATITLVNFSFFMDTISGGAPSAYLAWDSYYTYPHYPPIPTDWPRYLYTVDAFSRNDTVITSPSQAYRMNISLSNVGRDHINLTGLTSFILMDYSDLTERLSGTPGFDNRYTIANASSWFNNRNPILHVEYGTAVPPVVQACNLTAVVQNTANGNSLAGSTFNIYDVSAGTHEHFYLPFGSGSVSIPVLHDLYKWNATKGGYTGYPAYPEGGVAVPAVGFETCADITLYTQLTGPPADETNCTLSFTVEGSPCSGYMCVITNAQVSLSDGQATITNYAGFASFITAKNTSYDYSVSKTGYQGIEGTVDIGNDDAINIPIELTSGTVPTATTTTYAPGVPHDTTEEALILVMENAYAIVGFLLVIFFIGGLKMIAK